MVTAYTTIITGPNGWSLPSSGFVNPSYISGPAGQSDPNGSLGFDISSFASVFIAFEGTYTGQTALHQQTLDPTGKVGWFSVAGITPDAGGTATDSASTSGVGYVFPVTGLRHRIQVTALSTGTIIARIGENETPVGTITTAGAGGGGTSTPTGGTSDTLNITVATVIKASSGRLATVSVIVAGSASGTVNDCATTGAAATANQFGVLPNFIGVNVFNWPCGTGIVVVPGTGQTLAASWS